MCRCCQSRKLRDNYQTLFGAVSLILVGLGELASCKLYRVAHNIHGAF